MIESSRVYNTLIDILRADKRGLTLSLDEYNRLARVVNERVYSKYYADFEGSTSNIDTMAGFKQLNQTVALAGGVGTLPSDYYEMIGKGHYVDTGGTTRYIDLVTSLERAERASDYLTQPTLTHPVMEIGDLSVGGDLEIWVYPTTIASIDIDYLRTADVPYLDWYVNNSTMIVTYLATGAVGVTVPLGSTYSTGTAGAVVVNSTTTDWEWGDSDFHLILSIFCQLVGVAIPDQLLIETGTINEEKE